MADEEDREERQAGIWAIISPYVWFRDVRAFVYALLGLLAIILIAVFVDWRVLLVVPVAAYFADRWWKTHAKDERVCLIEIRAQGQMFRAPHVPEDMRVPDSATRIFFAPRRVYDAAQTWGVYEPIVPTPSNVVFCDYFNEFENIIIFNEDSEWTNLALVAQINQSVARSLKSRGEKLEWLEIRNKQLMMEAIQDRRAGKITEAQLKAIVSDLEEEVDVIREDPLSKRSFAHYYQSEIPRLKRQVSQLVRGIEEYGYAIGSELAHQLYGQPMSPEVENNIAMSKTKWAKIKMNIFENFKVDPELDALEDDSTFGPQQLHSLAKEASGATHRATAMKREQASRSVL